MAGCCWRAGLFGTALASLTDVAATSRSYHFARQGVDVKKLLLWTVLALLPAFDVATAAPKDGEGTVVNGNVRIWYRVEGARHSNALPVLMIHGGPGATARPFERTLGPALAKRRPVIYMDYRGAGRSDRPTDPQQYSFAILASDAEAIRNALGISKWAVFGHSNGGATAITYATKFPAATAALILCDPLLSPVDLDMNMIHKVAFAPPEKFEAARAVYKSDKSNAEKFDELIDLLGQRASYRLQFFDPRSNDVLAAYQNGLRQELGKELMEPALMRGLVASGFFRFDAYALVDKLSMPTLLLLGRFDSEISVDNAMKFAMTLGDGTIAVLERSGHHPYLEQTRLSAERVNAFLQKR